MGLKTNIKQKLMLHSMKKQKKAGFPLEDAETYRLSDDVPANFNNSYYLTAHSGDISLYLRLGERGDGSREVWANFQCGSDCFVNGNTLYQGGELPLCVSCTEIAKRWEHTYRGVLFAAEKGERGTSPFGDGIESEISLTFESDAPVYDFFTHGNDMLAARTYARVKWDDAFFEGLNKNKQTHYEQYGFVSGSVKIGDRTFAIEHVPAVRDHSYGMRDWGYMNRHFWLAAVSENGKAFNVSMVSYPCAPGLHAGNIYENGKIINLKDFRLFGDTVCNGKGPNEVGGALLLVDGRKLPFSGKRVSETVYSLQNGAYTLREGYGEYLLDGEVYRGVWEFGFHTDEKKWSAYEDLSAV